MRWEHILPERCVNLIWQQRHNAAPPRSRAHAAVCGVHARHHCRHASAAALTLPPLPCVVHLRRITGLHVAGRVAFRTDCCEATDIAAACAELFAACYHGLRRAVLSISVSLFALAFTVLTAALCITPRHPSIHLPRMPRPRQQRSTLAVAYARKQPGIARRYAATLNGWLPSLQPFSICR